MILEALITTRNADGSPHLAPMGPKMGDDPKRFLLRPFPSSQTCQNLLRDREGVLHITDDSLLMARAAIGRIDQFPSVRRAKSVKGFVLPHACRIHEFRITHIDESEERLKLEAEIVHSETHHDFFGFNRAKHAVVEAAVLATRLHLLPHDEVAAAFQRLRVIVNKTGGPAEDEAMTLLEHHLATFVIPEAAL
jgi:uncharacterized protein